ncbi:hypothetical protein BP6252_04259 [Coleophoma cylindrospora]|uniref:Carbohydrate esterase family 5 protein n=1 Tax=Coleophoma cylindrospora TaxID=1849047 RepID=A0A3D8S0M0_9HELO|nr:hypothetical protein BP6252_04259 [Coleophoma cylindrospora]
MALSLSTLSLAAQTPQPYHHLLLKRANSTSSNETTSSVSSANSTSPADTTGTTNSTSPADTTGTTNSTSPADTTGTTNSTSPTGLTSGNSTSNAACVPSGAVHMIVARASTEGPGEGIIGAVATTVKSMVPGSDSEAVDYPATLTNYTTSEPSGVAGMQKLIEDYATRCPDSKMALLGYSQGAQVAGDVMCGTSEQGFDTTAPLSTELRKNIVAVIQMGDPTHMPNLAQDVGNSTKTGIFPRKDLAACGSLTDITQSYCNSGDRFCDSGDSIPVHLSYIQVFGSAAAQFVVNQVTGNTTAKASSPTGTQKGGSSISGSTSPQVSKSALVAFVAVVGVLLL